jgi:CubicO group peptidase (beta-lactamase class C family)
MHGSGSARHIIDQVRSLRVSFVVALATLLLGQPTFAQNASLTVSLFERYLASLRDQTGIPGISAAVLQGGTVVWQHAFGKQDVEHNIDARPDTPYRIGDLSQVFGATVLLRKCVDQSYLSLADQVFRWSPAYGNRSTTVGQLLTHTAATGGYRRDLARFAALTPVIEQCAGAPYRQLLATEVFDRFSMLASVPGEPMSVPTATDRRLFDASVLTRYASVVDGVAPAYRVDSRGRTARVDYSGQNVDAATGVITSVTDLARFDAALGSFALLSRETLRIAWSRASSNGSVLPTGLGWYVQSYRNGSNTDEPIVWQYGLIKDASSGLILTLPNRDITLILLANSDGLSAPFALENGDVTTSLFAKAFLRLFAN